MRLYSGSSEQFVTDSYQNQIAEKLRNAFFHAFQFNPPKSEIRSWQNSLRAISQVIEHADLMDHGIILEYKLPFSSRRLDCLICGEDKDQKQNSVIVELKQWDECYPADGENEVMTWVGGGHRDTLHPSAQVRQYRMYLEDYHTAFYEDPDPIALSACAYLHNYNYYSEDVLFDSKFTKILKEAPLFTADHVDELTAYLTEKLKMGNGLKILRKIEENRFRPSKKLMKHVGNIIKGNSEYILLDEQLVVYDKVLATAKKGFHDKQKTVLIIKGGPGTGKSVIAINLMADLLLKKYNAHYATGSRAFTETLRKIIGTRGQVQFKYFNSYKSAQENDVDVLICDEAHRIRETSFNWRTPKSERSSVPQIEELLKVSKVSVFFIDDDQVVRPNEIGSVQHIKYHAEKMNCNVLEYELETQFRCSGSDSFIEWVNNTLAMHRTATKIWNVGNEFEVKIFSNPLDMELSIRQKVDQGYSARMTAGYCWKWSKQLSEEGNLVNDIVIGDFIRPWNARHDARRLPPDVPKSDHWAYDPNGINQVGCVYTAQGFEFDYVGVIIGEDLVYNFDKQSWIAHPEKSHDNFVKRSGDKYIELVKNTYRVLLTRGLLGCYICFMDKDTERFVKSRMEVT